MLNVEMLQNTFKWITTKINKTVNFYSVSIPLDIPISSLQLISCVRLFATPWTGACQVSLSITNSRSLLKLMSIESVMPSSHLILCCPLLLLPSISPSFRVFSNESAFCIKWPKYCSFSFSISHEIKRCLLLGRKPMTNLDSVLKSRDITLLTKVHLVKAMAFPVVMYGCETWTIKNAEQWRIDAFKLQG